MHTSSNASPDVLYRQGLYHFNRGEWQAAIAAFTELQAASDEYPDADVLLGDARLKLQFEGAAQPMAMAPPRRSLMLPALMVVALCLLSAAGYFGVQLLGRPAPAPVMAMVAATPVPPTAPARPVAAPTATALPLPTPLPSRPGTVMVRPADDASFIKAPSNIQIIADASGSMLAAVPGTDKLRWQVAKEALGTLLESGTIPLESYVGVRTYGRNRGQDCSDLEVALPLEPFSYERVLGAVQGLEPAVRGMTPLAASIRAAGSDLQATSGGATVILVTDGIESCDGDPVSEAAAFVAGGPDRKVHVVGFAIDDPAATEALRQIAANGNGLFFDAANSGELAAALRQAVVLTFQLITPSGIEVGAGTVGQEPIQLKPGTYRVKLSANPPVEQEFVVENGADTEILLRQDLGVLQAEVRGPAR